MESLEVVETDRHRVSDREREKKAILNGFCKFIDLKEYWASAFKDYTQFAYNFKM